MNQGLRSYCKLLSQDIGNAGQAFVNVNQTNANLHLVIPIYKTTGLLPIEISLIYSHANRTEQTEFGYGIKLNFYRKYILSSDASTITVINSDGSSDTFFRVGTSDQYVCTNVHATLEVRWAVDDPIIELVTYTDKYGNQMASFGESVYPNTIHLINGEYFSFIMSNGHLTSITNHKGDTAFFIYDSMSKVQSVRFVKDSGSIDMFTASFSYSSSSITAITYINNWSQNTTLFTNSFQLNQTTVKAIDGISQYRIHYFMSGNRVTYFKDGMTDALAGGTSISLAYYGNYSTATDSHNRTTYYYFDPQQLPLYDIDYQARAVAYRFDYDPTDGTIEFISKTNVISNNPVDTASHNLISNGYFSANLDYWVASESGMATIINDESNLFHAILGNKTLSMTSTNNENVVVTQTVSCSGIAFDDVTLSIWGHEMVCGSASADTLATAKVQLLRGTSPVATGTINFTKYSITNAPWELLAVSATPEKSYDTLVVTLTVSLNSTYAFDGVQVIRSPMGSNNQYDSEGNVVTSVSQKSTTNTEYTSSTSTPSNLPSQTLSPTSTLFDFEYDSLGNLAKAKTAYDVTVSNTYDVNNNCTDTIVASGSEALKTSEAYSSLGYPDSKTNDSGATTSFSFNNWTGQLSGATSPNGTALGYTYNAYSNFLSSTMSKNGSSISANYSYDLYQRLKTITTPKSDVYKFTYNNWNRVVDLCVGPTETLATNKLFTYEYQNQEDLALEQTGNITKVTYGTSGGAYTFTYNSIDQITAVNYIAPGGTTATQKYGFFYDNLGRIILSETILPTLTIQTEFSYNAAGQLSSMNDDIGNAVDYTYDIQGTPIQRKYSLQGVNEYVAIDPAYRSDGMNTQAVYKKFQSSSRYLSGFMNQFVFDEETQQYTDVRCLDLLGFSSAGTPTSLSPSVSAGLVAELYNLVPCITFTAQNGRLAYDVHAYASGGPNASIAFWFKIEGTFSDKTLFSTIAPSGAFIRVFFTATGKLNLELKENDGTIHTGVLITDTAFIANQWNFFALTWSNSQGTGDLNKCTYRLWLNNEKKAYEKVNPRYYVDNGNPLARLFIGCFYDGTVQMYKMIGKVTAILTSDTANPFPYEMDTFYQWTKEYLIENSFVNPLYDTIHAGGLNLYSRNQAFLNDYEIIPLNSNLLSFKGKAPKYMTLRRTTDFDRDRTFNYNQNIRRYAYVADGSELAYDFSAQESGYIGMKVCVSGEGVKQYLFQNIDSSGRKMGLYRQLNHTTSTSRSTLSIEIQGTIIATGIPLDNGIWTPIGFTWSRTIISDSVPTYQYQLRLVVGRFEDPNNPYVFTTMVTFAQSFGSMVTSIGRIRYGRQEPDGLGGYITVYDPLYGQIEMLCWRNAYLSQATITSLWNEMKVTTVSNQYDVFGRLKLKSYSTDDSYSPSFQTYEYAPRVGDVTKTSTRVSEESFHFADTSQNMDRTYSYDGNGNITSIVEGQSTTAYQYDYRGFLTQETGPNASFKYVYDANGNITSKRLLNDTPVTSFTYDNSSTRVLSDRLVGVGSKKVKYYNSVSIGNPVSFALYNEHNEMIEGELYSWEGRNLTRFRSEVLGTTMMDSSYAYDANGLRISKKAGAVEHLYFYDGGNLVSEVIGSAYLRFAYDENGLLSTLTYHDGTTSNRYFYVRDILLNIIGLKDVLGNLVVRYNYDAWGNILSVTGSEATTVGQANPFRYKGYYYDTETMMYYCQSRYYVPKWCRWLNADDPNYLQFDSPKGSNLFTYCGNNPIFLVDFSGRNPISDALKAFGSILAIAGGIFLCAIPGFQLLGAGLILMGAGGITGGIVGKATGQGFGAGWNIGTMIGTSAALMLTGGTFILGGTLMNIGGLLLATGAGSLIGGISNSSKGGSFLGGWLGGGIAGASLALASIIGAGMLSAAMTGSYGVLSTLGLFMGGFTVVPFAVGSVGGAFGQLITNFIDRKDIWNGVLTAGLLNGSFSMIAVSFALFGGALGGFSGRLIVLGSEALIDYFTSLA